MKYRYHIITPFSRWRNFPTLSKHLYPIRQLCWHPVFDADIPVQFGCRSWIEAHYSQPHPEGFFPGYWKTNWFLDHHEMDAEGRYLVLNDDDLYEEGFFDKIDAVEGELLICSMDRGGGKLMAHPDDMKCGYVGGEQLIVSGRLMKDERYEPHYEGDWGVISRLTAKTPPLFVPDAVVKFNCLPREL